MSWHSVRGWMVRAARAWTRLGSVHALREVVPRHEEVDRVGHRARISARRTSVRADGARKSHVFRNGWLATSEGKLATLYPSGNGSGGQLGQPRTAYSDVSWHTSVRFNSSAPLRSPGRQMPSDGPRFGNAAVPWCAQVMPATYPQKLSIRSVTECSHASQRIRRSTCHGLDMIVAKSPQSGNHSYSIS